MSSNDDKADLSNLKSRLGLNKGEEEEAGESDDSDSSEERGQGREDGASAGERRGDEQTDSSSSGVDDRLAALKESTQKSGGRESTGDAPESSGGRQAGDAASSTSGGSGAESSGPAGSGEGGRSAGRSADSGSDATGPSGGGGAARSAGGPPPGAQGPPPGAQGPPPTAQGPPPGTSTGSSSSTGTTSSADDGADFDDIDPDDVDLGEIEAEDDEIFSKPLIGLLVALLGIGVIFGFLAAQTMQTRELEQARINDAAQLQEELEPRLSDYDRAREIIRGLDPAEADFEAAKELGELEFSVDAGMLPGNRILLGEEIIGPFNSYTGQASVLSQLADEHARMTNDVHAEELEAQMGELDQVDDDNQIAAVFDSRGFRAHLAAVANDEAEPSDYVPSAARLVEIPEDFTELEPDEEGKVEVQVISARAEHGTEQASDRVSIQSLVPIVDTDFLNIEPGNAMQRYGERVEQLQFYVEELETTAPVLREEVDKVASSDPPPLLTFGAGEEPVEEAAQSGEGAETDDPPEGGDEPATDEAPQGGDESATDEASEESGEGAGADSRQDSDESD